MTIYDRPLWQIIRDEALPKLGEPFSASDGVEWVLARYPKFKPSTVQLHFRAMTANDPLRRHHRLPVLLIKTHEGLYRTYDDERDGLFDEDGRPLTNGSPPADETGDEEESQVAEEDVAFALEQHLEEFMDSNWERISFGKPLRRYEDPKGGSGRQFRTGVGVIDFLCEDAATGDLVVIELKKGRSSDKVLGQCQRYMGWVQEKLAKPGQKVRGLIIAPEQDDRLKYALKVAANVDMLCYRVDFQLDSPQEKTS